MSRPKYNLEGTTEYLANKKYRKDAEHYMDRLEQEIQELKDEVKRLRGFHNAISNGLVKVQRTLMEI